MKAENRIDLNIDNKGKGRRFESRFLQAGLVKYSFGVCLLSKEVIDRFAYKFVGCPVIIDHKDITDANAKDERVGVISKVWYNEYDGWFWCEGVVFDDEAISLIKDKGYNVSCQYNIDDYTENTANALHNGNPYDITILDGTPEHLAIVKNPRYEEALIAVNKGEDMKAENTEFRTGYDSDGDAYVYPLEGADDKKSDKKEKKDLYSDENFKENAKRLNEQFGEKPYSQWHKDVQKMLKKYGKTEEDWNNAVGANKELFKKEDKKDDKAEKKSSLDKVHEERRKVAEQRISELNDIKSKLKDLDSIKDTQALYDKAQNISNFLMGTTGILSEKEQDKYLELAEDIKDKIVDYQTEKDDKKYDKKEDKKIADTKISGSGIKETTDEHGRIVLSKKDSNEKVKIHKNGDYYLASYGQELKDDDGYTEFQVFPSASGKSFKTEKGARKWAIEKLSPDTSKEGKQLKLFNELEEQLERFVSLVAKNFDESKHDRDKDGKFTDSGNFSGERVDEQEAKLVKELKRLEKNGQDVSEIYKKLTGKEWGKKEDKKESKKENKPVRKSQKSDSVKFDKIGKVLTSILKDAEKSYKESK